MKPILFSTPMVEAILAGRKTQTRRVVKPQPATDTDITYMPNAPLDWQGEWFPYMWDTEEGERICKHPKYNVGDILWVRETWRPIEQDLGTPRYEYRATETINVKDKWKPSIFMPKEACRLFLKITNVRAERLHDISEQDAIAEGIVSWMDAVDNFKKLWISINKEESWKANPWVWVYEFKIEKK